MPTRSSAPPCSVDDGTCTGPAVTGAMCPQCGRLLLVCPAHREKTATWLNGHLLLAHPESVAEQVRELARDETHSAVIFANEERDPDVYRELADALRECQGAGAAR